MERLRNLIAGIIRNNITADAWNRVSVFAQSIADAKGAKELNTAFAATPRHTGRKTIQLTKSEQDDLSGILPALFIQGWTIDRLTRVWLLMHVSQSDKDIYLQKIENLFNGAEMHELVALYSALPVYAWPEAWKWRCTEGIRSNIGDVLEAVMYENPYPFEYLDEPAWNQMVMKAIFTDKQIDRITGLDKRANAQLAKVLIDYANERWAAHRTVNLQLWRLVTNFISDENFYMLDKLYVNGDEQEKKAALLACSQSTHPGCGALSEKEPKLVKAIRDKQLSWSSLIKEKVTS